MRTVNRCMDKCPSPPSPVAKPSPTPSPVPCYPPVAKPSPSRSPCYYPSPVSKPSPSPCASPSPAPCPSPVVRSQEAFSTYQEQMTSVWVRGAQGAGLNLNASLLVLSLQAKPSPSPCASPSPAPCPSPVVRKETPIQHSVCTNAQGSKDCSSLFRFTCVVLCRPSLPHPHASPHPPHLALHLWPSPGK